MYSYSNLYCVQVVDVISNLTGCISEEILLKYVLVFKVYTRTLKYTYISYYFLISYY